MITKDEYIKLNSLIDKQQKLQGVLRSFDSKHVWAKIGLVAVNGASQYKVEKHDDADFIHSIKNIETELTTRGIELIKAELLHVEAEISKYLKPTTQ